LAAICPSANLGEVFVVALETPIALPRQPNGVRRSLSTDASGQHANVDEFPRIARSWLTGVEVSSQEAKTLLDAHNAFVIVFELPERPCGTAQ